MPAKLDRCVKEVKAQYIKEGDTPEKVEERAWAICRERLNLAAKNLVEETEIIYHELFASLPTVDFNHPDRKYLKNKSQAQRDEFVKKVYKNTKQLLDLGHFVPVKDEHLQLITTDSFGQILDVSLEERQFPIHHFVIIGKLELSKHFQKIAAKPHGVSVEMPDDFHIGGYTGKDESLESPIAGMIMSNKTGTAMPQLKRVANFNNLGNHLIYTWYVVPEQFKSKGDDMPENENEKDKEKPKMPFGKRIRQYLTSLLKEIDDEFPDEESSPPSEKDKMKPKSGFEEKEEEDEGKEKKYESDEEPEEDKVKDQTKGNFMSKIDKKEFVRLKAQVAEYESQIEALEATDEQKEIMTLKEQVSSLRNVAAENAFTNLCSQGKMCKEQKKEFVESCETLGVDKMTSIFSKSPAAIVTAESLTTPGQQPATDVESFAKTEEGQKLFQMWTDEGLDEKEIETRMKITMENNKEQSSSAVTS